MPTVARLYRTEASRQVTVLVPKPSESPVTTPINRRILDDFLDSLIRTARIGARRSLTLKQRDLAM
jgi:hypothetical protein